MKWCLGWLREYSYKTCFCSLHIIPYSYTIDYTDLKQASLWCVICSKFSCFMDVWSHNLCSGNYIWKLSELMHPRWFFALYVCVGGVGRHDMCMGEGWEDMICVWGRGGKTWYVYGGGVGRHDMCMGEGWEDMICVWGRGGKTWYVYGGGVGRHDMCMGEGWEDMICVWGRGGKTWYVYGGGVGRHDIIVTVNGHSYIMHGY